MKKMIWLLLVVLTLLGVAFGIFYANSGESDSEILENLQATALSVQPQILDFFTSHKEDFSRLDERSKACDSCDSRGSDMISIERKLESNGYSFKYDEYLGGSWVPVDDKLPLDACFDKLQRFLELPDCPFGSIIKKGDDLVLRMDTNIIERYSERYSGWGIEMDVINSNESTSRYVQELDSVWSLRWRIYAPV